MSMLRNITINCPKCNAEGPYTVWDSVNVDLDPELKEKVMNASLFKWTCPACKKSCEAPYSFLYNDMRRNLMVQFDAQRNHLIPFAEYIKVQENGLEIDAIYKLAASFRETHPRMNILFDTLSDDNELVFTVYEMPVNTWQATDQKHKISHSEYLQACQGGD